MQDAAAHVTATLPRHSATLLGMKLGCGKSASLKFSFNLGVRALANPRLNFTVSLT
jgi:hypothetical protein